MPHFLRISSFLAILFCCITAQAQLSGTYTIGGVTPDYATINGAISDLYTVGVNGPVVFDVRPGSYHEVIFMNGLISGSSQVNSITFQSENGDSLSVEIWRDFPDADVHVWRMDDVSNVILRKLHIHNRGTLNGRVVQTNLCGDLTIENCKLEGNPSGTSSNTICVLSVSDPDSNIVVRNNWVNGGTDHILMVGNNSAAGNVLVEDNIAGNIKADQMNGVAVLGNETGYIFFQNCSGAYRIEGNIFDDFAGEAIYLLSSNSSAGRVVNNTMKKTTAWNTNIWAIRSINSDNVSFLHNTIEFNTTSTYEHHFCLYVDGSDNLNIYNNNFVKRGEGKVIRLFNSNGNSSDYNNFYAESGEINYGITSMALWQSTMGLDSNSVSVDPVFSTNFVDSLYPTHNSVINGGTALPSVPSDIHGDTRNSSAPSIGAFEVVLPPNVDLGPDTTYCDAATLDAMNAGNQFLWSTGDTTQTIAVSSSGTFWVESTNSEGTDRDTVVITINQTPIVLLPDSAEFCASDSLLLDPQASASNYLWSTLETTPTIYSQVSGWNSVTASNGSCASLDSTFVSAIPVLQIDLGNDTSICQGESVALDAGVHNASYLWSNGDTTQTISIVSSGTFSVDVSDQCGIYSDTISVIVNSLPSISITAADTACEGEVVVLTAFGGTSYQWNSGSNTNPYSTNAITPNDTAFVVIGTDSNGCTDTASHVLYVHLQPQLSIVGDDSICDGETVTLAVSGANSYLWNTGSSSNPYVVSPAVDTTYQVVGTDVNGCVDTLAHFIYVGTNPIAQITGDTIICEGDTTTLSGSNGGTYLWSTGEQSQEIDVSPVADQSYSLVITEPDGCSDSASVSVNVNPLPAVPVISQNGGDLTSTSASSYTWYDSIGNVVGTGQSHTPSANGLYWVEVTDANGCSSLSDPFDFQWIGVPENIRESELLVYPNPCSDILTIELRRRASIEHVQILDALGRVVRDLSSGLEQYSMLEIAVGDLTSAVYFVYVQTSEGIVTKRISVH